LDQSTSGHRPAHEKVRLSRLSVTDEWNVERGSAVLGE
jgi:hypothetical protein